MFLLPILRKGVRDSTDNGRIVEGVAVLVERNWGQRERKQWSQEVEVMCCTDINKYKSYASVALPESLGISSKAPSTLLYGAY